MNIGWHYFLAKCDPENPDPFNNLSHTMYRYMDIIQPVHVTAIITVYILLANLRIKSYATYTYGIWGRENGLFLPNTRINNKDLNKFGIYVCMFAWLLQY